MFLGLLAVILALIVFLAGSIAVDGLIGRSRLDALVNISITNPNGPEVRAFVARPSTPGPHPAVIMIHEWWGLKPEIVGKAEALAQEGYVVIAPDTFRGSTTSWIPRAIYQVTTTPAEQVDGDLDAVFEWLTAQPDVQADQIAIMGFCYGGGASLRYSLSNDQLAATAVFYGSTIADAERLRVLSGPVLGVFGSADNAIPVSEVQAFEAALDQAGVPNQITIYEGQPHAFVQSIDEIRQGGPQQEAWNELLTFLRQNLQAQAATPPSQRAGVDDVHVNTTHAFTPARLLHLFVCNRAIAL
jgi:carboxymethylenebutenolidase